MSVLGDGVTCNMFDQIEAKAFPDEVEARKQRKAEAEAGLKHLRASRYPQRDFFVADIVDANPRDDLASMEHPIFVLQAGDRRDRVYERNGVTVKIKPGSDGCATIHDKDIWIYCISQLVEALNQKRADVGRTVRFTAYDFMVSTNRRTDGDSYNRFAQAMGRLKGTTIETNIETADFRQKAGFGLIDSWQVIDKDGQDRMVAVEVTLPDWLYRAVSANQVLAIHRDYFRLRKPLDRRLYELARKHCGTQPSWRIGLAALREKTGSTAPLRNFRLAIKSLAEANELPAYTVTLDGDVVTFRPDTDRVIVPKTKKARQRKAQPS